MNKRCNSLDRVNTGKGCDCVSYLVCVQGEVVSLVCCRVLLDSSTGITFMSVKMIDRRYAYIFLIECIIMCSLILPARFDVR